MMDKKLIKDILNEYSLKRNQSVLKSENNVKIAFNIEKFAQLDGKKRSLIFEKGKSEFLGRDTAGISHQLEEIKLEQEKILQDNGLSFADLEPHFECAKCRDTGFINGETCLCFRQSYNNKLMRASKINLSDVPFLKDYDVTVFEKKEQENVRTTVRKLKDFVDEFDDMKIRNIILIGGTGAGKTFLAQSIAKEVISTNHTALFTSAFNLNNFFLSVHTGASTNKIAEMNGYIETDLLIIDDLGTEPLLRNVTKEYLLLLLNERTLKNKSTIITTNMSPENILDKYNERVFSRIFNKSNSVTISMNGKDLRIKKAA